MSARARHWGGRTLPPAIVATAAWNGLGFTPRQIWAFRRAEIAPFVQAPFRTRNHAHVTMAHIQTLPVRQYGAPRLATIGRRVVQELGPALTALAAARARVSLLLCVPERFTSRSASAGRQLIERAVLEPLAAAGVQPQVIVESRGHAGPVFGLERCTPDARQGPDATIVVGLDTCYDPHAIRELSEQDRLFDGDNVGGIIPGEGGAAFVLVCPELVHAVGIPPVAQLASVALGSEPAHMFSGQPCQALGLSSALRAIADRVQAEQGSIDWWMVDVGPESYRAHEWLLTMPRAAAGVCRELTTMELLPTFMGDLGVATVPTAVAIAAEGFAAGDPAARSCLVSASSIGEERAGLLLTM